MDAETRVKVMEWAGQTSGQPGSGKWCQLVEGKLRKIEEIPVNLAKMERERQKEVARHISSIQVIDVLVAEIRRECPHIVTKHHGDPAGGSDSFTVCEICGANL